MPDVVPVTTPFNDHVDLDVLAARIRGSLKDARERGAARCTTP